MTAVYSTGIQPIEIYKTISVPPLLFDSLPTYTPLASLANFS